MQLKHVVLPAPLGPMSPTISNSLTWRVTSSSACRPPKRMATSCTSRTDIDALRSPGRGVHGEATALQPAPDRHRERAEALGLEEERQHGQQPEERLDDVAGVVLHELDPEGLGDVREVLREEHVAQRERDDAAPSS